jgi:hypothetical protein
VLFNGGVFNSPQIRQRLLEVLQSWFRADDPNWSPILLDNDRLDLAVAHGAAYYGTVRRGRGVRIAAGLARTYYIGVESEPPSAVCLVPGNAEPGQAIDLIQPRFELLVHQPAEFPLYVSSTRLTDVPGELLPVDREQMKPLPPIRTVLRTRGKKLAGTLACPLARAADRNRHAGTCGAAKPAPSAAGGCSSTSARRHKPTRMRARRRARPKA